MTYTLRRYQSYQDYLDDDQLESGKDYRLLSNGEVIEMAGEDDANLRFASLLFAILLKTQGFEVAELIRLGNKEMQVSPVGDKCVNRKPDLLVLQPEHLQIAKQALLLGMAPPQFVAEVVSPGSESSDNYLRDYVWKREQYQAWQIPEYWIIDPHKKQITVLTLVNGDYQAAVYQKDATIVSSVFPLLKTTAVQLFSGDI